MKKTLERFLSYVAIDTQSKTGCDTIPSTPGQFTLAKKLCEELKELGLVNIELTEHCHVYATLPANCKGVEPIGFIAHLDTSPAISGKDIKPKVIENFDGNDILLNEETGCTLYIEEFPELKRYIGQTLITTDGTTLLGSDDKSGITEIMGMLDYFSQNPDVLHGDVQIGFTPDEEIGLGTEHFDVERFGAKLAYTVDGAELGKFSYENFFGAKATITATGVGIHPGRGKNRLKNALLMAIDFQNMLPAADIPFHTEGYEGFYHLTDMTGDVETATLSYRVCDFDEDKFIARKKRIEDICEYLNKVYGANSLKAEIIDNSKNMRKMIEPHFHAVENIIKGMENAGVEPSPMPTRGGTDGVRLSFMGLPCPNLNTGSHNCHGRFECVPLESIHKITEILVEIVKVYVADADK